MKVIKTLVLWNLLFAIFFSGVSFGDSENRDLSKDDPDAIELTRIVHDILQKIYNHETEKLVYLVHPEIKGWEVDSRLTPDEMRETLEKDAKDKIRPYYETLYNTTWPDSAKECRTKERRVTVSPYTFYDKFGDDFEVEISKSFEVDILKRYFKCRIRSLFTLEFFKNDGKFYFRTTMFAHP